MISTVSGSVVVGTAGVLSIAAGPTATEGGLANMVVRAVMQYDGREALVDLPITIKVAK